MTMVQPAPASQPAIPKAAISLKRWRQHSFYRVLLAMAFGAVLASAVMPVLMLLGQGNRPALGPAMIDLAYWLCFIPLLVGLAAMIWRRVGGETVMLAGIVSAMIGPVLKPVLGDGFGWLWPVYAVLYPALWLNILIPARRSIARSFTLLILTVTLMTTALFHLIVVAMAYHSVVAQERTATRQAMISVIDLPADLFDDQCVRRGMDCWVGTNDQAPTLPSADLQSAFRDIHNHMVTEQRDGLIKIVEPQPPAGLVSPLPGHQFVYYYTGDEVRVITDRADYSHLTWRYQIYLGALMSAAHFWWVFGGFLLLAFHQSKTAWRVAKGEAAVLSSSQSISPTDA